MYTLVISFILMGHFTEVMQLPMKRIANAFEEQVNKVHILLYQFTRKFS